MSDGIVITGMGVVSPIGHSESAFWTSLTAGRSGAAPVTGFDTSELQRQMACQVREPVEAVPGVGRASSLALAAAKQAIDNAGLDRTKLADARTAVIVGTTMGETEFIENRLDAPADQWLAPEQAREIARGAPGCISAQVGAQLGATGPRYDLYGACAAGNMAMEAARRMLLAGECDAALAGGADGFSRLAFVGFMRARVMSAGVCRPFDRRRDGLLVGEGAGMFVLERESTARARGATVRARLLGAASTCETYHPTRPHPDGEGLCRAGELALRDAGLSPEDIDYVCAHGTGTPQNDAIEVKVMERLFSGGVAFSSIKALTGHCMGAAAALEAAACVLSLQHQQLVPTWHLEEVLEPCALDAVRGAVRRAKVRCVLNNSAGFGGYNSSVVFAGPD